MASKMSARISSWAVNTVLYIHLDRPFQCCQIAIENVMTSYYKIKDWALLGL